MDTQVFNDKYNFIDENLLEIKNLLDQYLLTPKFRAGLLNRYKIELPNRVFFQKRIVPDTDSHKYLKWQINDEIAPSKRCFILNLEIEVPIEEKFRHHAMCSISIYIKPKNRRKEFGELYNINIDTNHEDNFLKLAAMIQKIGREMNKEFEIPIKLSNKSI